MTVFARFARFARVPRDRERCRRGILAASALAVATAAATTAGAQIDLGKRDVGSMFRSSCQGCHTIPDTRRERDRAWLDQINRTA